MMSTATCRICPARLKTLLRAFIFFFIGTCLLPGCNPVVSEEARQRFKDRTGPFTLTIFPVRVTTGGQIDHDAGLARRIGEYLRSRNVADPTVSSKSIEMPAYYGAAEIKRIRLLARHFEQAVRHTHTATDYAFMAEIVLNREGSRVVGVYFFLADRFARIASARMANSHHAEFRRINPGSRDDGFRVLTGMIQEGWGLSSP